MAFTDGLSQDYKYEVVSKKCKTVFEAIEVCSQLDFCKMKFNQNEDMVELNAAKFARNNIQENKKPLVKVMVPKHQEEDVEEVESETEEQDDESDDLKNFVFDIFLLALKILIYLLHIHILYQTN